MDTLRFGKSSVPATDEYLNRHQELRNLAFQNLQLARFRSTKRATKKRRIHKHIPVGKQVMVYGDQFATQSGRSKKLEPMWRGPFTITKFDEYTENYTVKMDAKMYRRPEGTFHAVSSSGTHRTMTINSRDELIPDPHLSQSTNILSGKWRKYWTTANDTIGMNSSSTGKVSS